MRVLFAIGLTLTPLIASGCVGGSRVKTPSAVTATFCAVYRPIYVSEKDTEETKRQVDLNNVIWMERCDDAAGKPR